MFALVPMNMKNDVDELKYEYVKGTKDDGTELLLVDIREEPALALIQLKWLGLTNKNHTLMLISEHGVINELTDNEFIPRGKMSATYTTHSSKYVFNSQTFWVSDDIEKGLVTAYGEDADTFKKHNFIRC